MNQEIVEISPKPDPGDRSHTRHTHRSHEFPGLYDDPPEDPQASTAVTRREPTLSGEAPLRRRGLNSGE